MVVLVTLLLYALLHVPALAYARMDDSNLHRYTDDFVMTGGERAGRQPRCDGGELAILRSAPD
jgi:hypothetical protein